MKVGIIADIHLQGGCKSKEAVALLKSATKFNEEGVDLIVVAGDIFEGTSDEEQRLVFKEFLSETDAPKIVLRGNHDEPLELCVYQGPGTYCHEKPCTSLVETKSGPIFLGILPHFSAGALALQSENVTEFGEKGTSMIVSILEKFYQEIHNQPNPAMVLFHGTVSGAKLDNGMIPRENGIHLPLSVLETLGVPVVGGHYHKCQNIAGKIWYPGSITRQTWGESKDDKGILIWEHNGTDWEPKPAFHSLNPQPMVTVDAEWTGEKFVIPGTGEEIDLDPTNYLEDTKVRFRYTVKAEEVHTLPSDLKDKLRAIDPEAKIEKKTIQSVAVRNEEMMEASGIEESLRVFYKSKGLAESEIDSILELRRELIQMERERKEQREEVAA